MGKGAKSKKKKGKRKGKQKDKGKEDRQESSLPVFLTFKEITSSRLIMFE